MNALPEYECHRESREAGLNCLRDQLTGDIQDEGVSQKPCSIFTGDELLTWTIETFNTFYSKTWFARRILPIFYTIPLLISYFSFIYDNYSDIELSHSYYKQGYGLNETLQEKVIMTKNMTDMIPSPKYENFCPLYVMKTSSGQDCEYLPRRSKVRTEFVSTRTFKPFAS